MKEFKKILYATDFSESSAPAAGYARYLAQLSGATIHVLHVVSELLDQRTTMIQPEALGLLEKEVEIHAIKDMSAFCQEQFDDAVKFTTEVVIGTPFKQILKKADEIQADLIVMGTHGRTGIEHVIVGSTAERIVRRAKVPVMTVKQTV